MLLSPFLFLLVIDWIMKTTTTGRNNGIQWTLWIQLDDLDLADDLALLAHSYSQMQDKTTRLETVLAGTGLKISRKKTELMKINSIANIPVTVRGEPIREVDFFFYLRSAIDRQGARTAMSQLGSAKQEQPLPCSRTSGPSRLQFNSNVKSVLLYGSETWRKTKTMLRKIQTFINTCLRRIYNIRWPDMISKDDLWEQAGQEPVAKEILKRKWGWIGLTL